MGGRAFWVLVFYTQNADNLRGLKSQAPFTQGAIHCPWLSANRLKNRRDVFYDRKGRCDRLRYKSTFMNDYQERSTQHSNPQL